MSEPEQRVPMPCSQCGRPGVHGYEAQGYRFNLCVEHAAIFDENRRQNVAMYSHLANEAYAQIYGLPPQPLQLPNPAPRVNVNTVNVQGDNHGVINTGTVRALKNSVNLVQRHDPALAQSLVALANGIMQSTELAAAQKADAIDLLRSLSEDAAKPAGDRQPKVTTRTVASALQGIIATSANLAKIWETAGRMLGL